MKIHLREPVCQGPKVRGRTEGRRTAQSRTKKADFLFAFEVFVGHPGHIMAFHGDDLIPFFHKF